MMPISACANGVSRKCECRGDYTEAGFKVSKFQGERQGQVNSRLGGWKGLWSGTGYWKA